MMMLMTVGCKNQTAEDGKKLWGIEIASPPDKMDYLTGQTLDLTGLRVNNIYANSVREQTQQYTVSGNASVAGVVPITIVSKIDIAKRATFNITVTDNRLTLTGIEIVSPPDKVVYAIGETVDLTGLRVNNVYDDGSREETSDYTAIHPEETFTTGTATVVVKAKNDVTKSAAFDITISDKLVVAALPTFYIKTQNSAEILSKETYVNMELRIVSDNAAHCIEKTGFKDGIRGRGNATWDLPKKPYRIKFDKKTSLFGLESAKSWVLLADYRSPTLLQNAIAFELGRRLEFPFANHFQHVNLVLNGKYQGTYILTEQVQVGKGRVDISETEGFLVELDFHYDEEPKFKTNSYRLPVMIKSPELSDPYSSGYDFVKTAINGLESAMLESTFPNSGYGDLIDVDNVVDYLIVNDILMNFELQVPASVYMYRDAVGKIKMGPLWDFDCGYGYEDNNTTFYNEYTGRVGLFSRRYGQTGQAFIRRFFDDPAFVAKYHARWNAKYADIQDVSAFIDAMHSKLNTSLALNGRRWAGALNHETEMGRMKTWWGRRIPYLNVEISNSIK
jgi:hypothetical protein